MVKSHQVMGLHIFESISIKLLRIHIFVGRAILSSRSAT